MTKKHHKSLVDVILGKTHGHHGRPGTHHTRATHHGKTSWMKRAWKTVVGITDSVKTEVEHGASGLFGKTGFVTTLTNKSIDTINNIATDVKDVAVTSITQGNETVRSLGGDAAGTIKTVGHEVEDGATTLGGELATPIVVLGIGALVAAALFLRR